MKIREWIEKKFADRGLMFSTYRRDHSFRVSLFSAEGRGDFDMSIEMSIGTKFWHAYFQRDRYYSDGPLKVSLAVPGLAIWVSGRIPGLDLNPDGPHETGIHVYLPDIDDGDLRMHWRFDSPSHSWSRETPFWRDGSFNVTKARALLNGYGRERALSEAEQAALPLVARGAALRFLLTRLVDFLNVPKGALVKPKDPLEYVRKLRFQQGVKTLRDYGVTQPGCVA